MNNIAKEVFEVCKSDYGMKQTAWWSNEIKEVKKKERMEKLTQKTLEHYKLYKNQRKNVRELVVKGKKRLG